MKTMSALRPGSRNSLNLLWLALAIALVAGAIFWNQASSLGALERTEQVTYAFSNDPADVVLFVSRTASTPKETRSMTIYGDGRVELSLNRWDPIGTYELKLTPPELSALIAIAAEHRLPEWDYESIGRRIGVQLERQQISEREHVRVIIALESYQRGTHQHRDFVRSFDFLQLTAVAEAAPQVTELIGLSILTEELLRLWGEAERGGDI
ncbi:MAG: hypothetical protein AAF772_12035 [Acidobacteriota bacterium]